MSAIRRNIKALLQRATGRALLGTLLGNIPGFLLPFAIAARMHVGQLTDAYAFTLGIALFASALFSGVLQTNVLPILQRMKHLGRAAFVGRLRGIIIQSTVMSILLYTAIGVASLLYTAHRAHWTPQQQELMRIVTVVLIVFVVASTINAILSAALNSLNSFFRPAATQALRSIVPLTAIAFVSQDSRGLITIAILVAGGELTRTLVLAHHLRNSTLSLSSALAPQDYMTELPLWRVAAPVGLSLLVAGVSPLIDRSVAASLSTGSVTYIDLGEKVFQVPLQIIQASLVLVAGTYWADIRTTDVPRLKQHVRRTLMRGSAVCVGLLAIMMVVLAVTFVVAGSTLAGGSTSELLSIIAILLIGLPGAFFIACGARFLTSTRTTYLLPAFGVFYFITNLGFDLVGAHWLGIQGIALSSTLCRYVSGVLYLIIMKRLMTTHFHGIRLNWHRQTIADPGP